MLTILLGGICALGLIALAVWVGRRLSAPDSRSPVDGGGYAADGGATDCGEGGGGGGGGDGGGGGE